MDLKTRYLGMVLRSPLVPSASPLSEDLGNIRKMEDAGASAIVMHSLFEEQLREAQWQLHQHLTDHTDSFAEATDFFPSNDQFAVGPEEYLEHIQAAKKAVKIPIIASLNGRSPGKWIEYAKLIEQAGADALELNVYYIPMDMNQSSSAVEENYLEILKAVRAQIKIPLAMKLSPYFSNLAYMAKKFDDSGADGLVLFNRFYQPDIELENLETKTDLLLSTPHSLRLPLRWVSILYGKVSGDLAASGGIHRAEDAIKLVLAGAAVTMLCSVLLSRGIDTIRVIEKKMAEWLEEHEYSSLQQMQGSMSHAHCERPNHYERVQYIRTLQSFWGRRSVQ